MGSACEGVFIETGGIGRVKLEGDEESVVEEEEDVIGAGITEAGCGEVNGWDSI